LLQVDIHELDNEIVLKADTPGMTGADVKVRSSATAHDRIKKTQ
jgi:HSP20 family molecular chaperone IbpA